MTMPRLLPHTIQLCIHCPQHPAGFWVSRNSGQTVRRPLVPVLLPATGPALRSRDPVR